MTAPAPAPAPAPVPTKPQAELLSWLVECERAHRASVEALRAADPDPSRSYIYDRQMPATFSGGSLISFYAMKYERDRPGSANSYGKGGYASSGWRRAGGTALANLAKREYVEQVRMDYGTPHYELTDLGRQAERQYQIVPGEVRVSGQLSGWWLVGEHKDGPRWWIATAPGKTWFEVVYAGEIRKLAVLDPADYKRTFSQWPWPVYQPEGYDA